MNYYDIEYLCVLFYYFVRTMNLTNLTNTEVFRILLFLSIVVTCRYKTHCRYYIDIHTEAMPEAVLSKIIING